MELLNSRMRNMELEPVGGRPSMDSLSEEQIHQEYLADIRFVFLSPFIKGALTKLQDYLNSKYSAATVNSKIVFPI